MDGQHYPYNRVKSDNESNSEDGASSSSSSSTIDATMSWIYNTNNYYNYINNYNMPGAHYYHPAMSYPPPMPTYTVPLAQAYPISLPVYPRPSAERMDPISNSAVSAAAAVNAHHTCNSCRIKMGQPPLPNQVPKTKDEDMENEIALSLQLYDIAASIDQCNDDELTAELEKLLTKTLKATTKSFK